MTSVPILGSDEAEALDREAAAAHRADPTRTLAGKFNTNTPVRGVYNVRRPTARVTGNPNPWRTHSEAVVLHALGGMGGRVPELFYTDPDGRFMIQNWAEARPLDEVVKSGAVASVDEIPQSYFEGVARFWRDLQDTDLPNPDPSVFAPMSRRLAVSGSHDPGIVRAPETLADYTALHTQMIAAFGDESTRHSEFIARRLHRPGDPERYAAAILGRIADTPLAAAHPDLHLGNLGVKDAGVWSPFFFDPEFVGLHDPRHALASMLCAGEYGPAKRAQIVDAHSRVARSDMRPTFEQDVEAWRRVTDIHLSTQIVNWWANETQKEQPNLLGAKPRIPSFTRLLNSTAQEWGGAAVSEKYVWETMVEAARITQQRNLIPETVVAAQGFGVLAARRVTSFAELAVQIRPPAAEPSLGRVLEAGM